MSYIETQATTIRRYGISAALGIVAVFWTPLALIIPYFAQLIRDGGIIGLLVLIVGQVLLSLGAIIRAHTLFDNWPGIILAYGSVLVAAAVLVMGFTAGLLMPSTNGETIKLDCTQGNNTVACDTQQN